MANELTQAAHILIDAVVAFQPGDDGGSNSPMNVAVRRINEVPGLVTVDYLKRSVDVSGLINGGIVSLYVLGTWLAAERGTSIEVVMAELREQMDELAH